MKFVLLSVLVGVVSLAGTGVAQERIELFADAGRTACDVADHQPSVVTLHVFLTGPDTATLAGFKAQIPACWTGATWLADVTDYVSIGTSQGEMSVAFGQCLAPPVHVAQIMIATSGTAPGCCNYAIQQPVSFPLQYVDCGFAEINAAPGQSVTINATASCPCMLPVAVQPTTWGSVKSLYR